MSEFLSGLVIRKAHTQSPRHLPRHPNNLSSRKRNFLTHLHPNLAPQKPNGASSPSCSVTWWILRNSPASSTPKSIGTWYVPINRLVRKSSSVLTDTLRNSWAMVCLSISAIPTPMKMTPKEQYELGLASSLRWKICLRVYHPPKVSPWLSGLGFILGW